VRILNKASAPPSGYSASSSATGPERVDAACARALLLNARSYKSVAAILRNGKDKALAATADVPILFHPNIRGRGYYN